MDSADAVVQRSWLVPTRVGIRLAPPTAVVVDSLCGHRDRYRQGKPWTVEVPDSVRRRRGALSLWHRRLPSVIVDIGGATHPVHRFRGGQFTWQQRHLPTVQTVDLYWLFDVPVIMQRLAVVHDVHLSVEVLSLLHQQVVIFGLSNRDRHPGRCLRLSSSTWWPLQLATGAGTHSANCAASRSSQEHLFDNDVGVPVVFWTRKLDLLTVQKTVYFRMLYKPRSFGVLIVVQRQIPMVLRRV